jgi:hypothetical protein
VLDAGECTALLRTEILVTARYVDTHTHTHAHARTHSTSFGILFGKKKHHCNICATVVCDDCYRHSLPCLNSVAPPVKGGERRVASRRTAGRVCV